MLATWSACSQRLLAGSRDVVRADARAGRFHSSWITSISRQSDVVGSDDGEDDREGARPGLDECLLRGPQAARVTGHGLVIAGGTGLRARGGGGAGADPAGLPGA